MLTGTGQLNVMADRAVIPPWGAAGAPPSSVNAFAVIRDGTTLEPSAIPGKVKSFQLEAGDVVLMRTTAGGGVGDPLDREPTLVLEDASEGYVTPERAEGVYGVVIKDGHVDAAATERLRGELRSRRRYFEVADGADLWDERGCRLCPLGRDAADRAGVSDGDMVEYVSDTTAPLRAWGTILTDAIGETVPLGPVARGILRVSIGDAIRVRALKASATGAQSSS